MRSVTSRRSFLAASALVLASRRLPAQKFSDGDTLPDADTLKNAPSGSGKDNAVFSSDVKVVSVLATVRTKAGEIIANLTKDDFILSEDKQPQTIKYFSRETNLPLILGLLVDTSGSQRNVLEEEETASYKFLDKVLREDQDKTFLAHFDFDTELLQDLTSSKQKLREALDALEVPGPGSYRGRGGYGGRGGVGKRGGGQGGGTTLYDAVYLASDEIMRHQQGRKAVILLTDGVDHGSQESMGTAIEQAQRADTLIYSIMFEGEEGGGGGLGGFGRIGPIDMGPDGYKVLQKMSRETGGGFFEVSRKMGIDAIYKRIEEELRSQYSIGYTPDRPGAGGLFRAISLKAKRKDLVVQARQGYYPTD
jgi:VWFA-related protein